MMQNDGWRFTDGDNDNLFCRWHNGVFLALILLALAAMPARAAVYSLGTTNLLVGPAAGTDSVVLAVTPSTGGWTTSANASWLHIHMSGQGKTNVVFTYDGNPGATRSGTLSIANITLTVAQAGSTYVADGTPTILASGMLDPQGVAVDGAGNVYFSDATYGTIEKWTPASGDHTTLVSGLGQYDYVALDSAGDVYISDNQNNVIEEWNASSGNVAALVSSGLNGPNGIAVDSAGNVFIADSFDYALKQWSAASGTLSTLANLSPGPVTVALDAASNLYLALPGPGPVVEWAGSTNFNPVVTSGLNQPYGLAVDGSGNVYIGDSGNNEVKEWSAAGGSVTVLASDETNVTGVAVDGAGNVYFAYDNDSIAELPHAFVDPTARTEPMAAGSDALPAVVPATANLQAPFNPTSDQPWLAITGVAGGVVSYSFAANSGASRTAHISLLGQTISIVQAGFILGTTALLEGPGAGADSVVLAANPTNAAWTASSGSAWLHTSQSGSGNANVIFTFDANTGPTRSGSLTIAGYTVVVTQAGSAYVADGTPVKLASGLDKPTGISVDHSGNVDIAGYGDGTLKQWVAASDKVLTLIPANLQAPVDTAVDAIGNIYIAQIYSIQVFTPATGILANAITNVYFPDQIAFDSLGNLYMADSFHYDIEECPAGSTNVVTLFTNGLDAPEGMAIDVASNIYISDTGHSALKLLPAGASNTIILLSSNSLSTPYALAVDGGGNVYICDGGNDAIQVWSAATSNLITMVPASAGIAPNDLALDSMGNIYFDDYFHGNLYELPKAFVNPSPRMESAAAGYDSLPPVLPSSENLLAPFNPVSDQSWLTIAGVADGVVHFSFAANSGGSRKAHITLLGQSIPVTQAAYSASPSFLVGPQLVAPGVVQFVFTNSTSPTFTILSTTNLQIPGSNWTVLAHVTNTGSPVFLYTSQPTTNDPVRFYGVRSP